MKFKVNKGLVPIKAHFFFFFAALGPVLPQINVFGRQLGVSPVAMGLVTAVLPLLWAVAKPLFGYIVDFWPAHRKLVFMILIIIMSGTYCGLWFLPMPENAGNPIVQYVYQLNDTVYIKRYDKSLDTGLIDKYKCQWTCSMSNKFDLYLTNSSYVNTVYIEEEVTNSSCSLLNMSFNDCREGNVICEPKANCNLLCLDHEILHAEINRSKRELNVSDSINLMPKFDDTGEKKLDNLNKLGDSVKDFIKNNEFIDNNYTKVANDTKLANETKMENDNKITNNTKTADDTSISNDTKMPNDTKISNETNVTAVHEMAVINKMAANETLKTNFNFTEKVLDPSKEGSNTNFYLTAIFWWFVVLSCVGTVAFNVANCIGDAVCFDVLGPEKGSKYGAQRAWGTAGYGLTALIGGWLVDAFSEGEVKDFTPAFVVCLVCTAVDLYSCRKLNLPSLSSPEDSGKALRAVLKIPKVVVFIIFAIVAGTFDSFIIYYMFWFLEELAEQTGYMSKIKLIEGIIIAAQCLIGELLFFFFSGKIIDRLGYGHTLTISLFCYGVRMICIAFITNPWQLVYIEALTQGPTYALCYSTIVGYAAHVAPEGYSATVQGIVAGMDDGVGFALGSLVGGQLYSWAGGRGSFQALGVVALLSSGAHAIFYHLVTKNEKNAPKPAEVAIPEEGEKMLPSLSHSNSIYRDTVIPLKEQSNR